MRTIATVAADAATYFREMAPRMVVQHEGCYSVGQPCCVGAHLAGHLGLDRSPSDYDYLRGADAWARRVGGNRAHAILLLRAAGAPHDPFGLETWAVPPAEVFARVAEAESLPSLEGADLAGIDLSGADLHDAGFRGADLQGADLWKANLEGANLRCACLFGARLDEAILRGADLRGADLRDTDLKCASLEGADLTGASLSLRGVRV